MQKNNKQVTCSDIEGKTYQVSAGQMTFRPAVYGIIVQDAKILLSKQWQGYDFPGGGIELGEPTDEALKREVREETGVEVRVGKLLDSHHSFFKLPFRDNFVHSIHLYYECQAVGGELSTKYLDKWEKQYAAQPEWLELSELPRHKIYCSIDYREILKKYL